MLLGGADTAGRPIGRTDPLQTGRCGRCDRPLTGREPSPDFCGQRCQDWFHKARSAPQLQETSAGSALGLDSPDVRIWSLPKVSATPVCDG